MSNVDNKHSSVARKAWVTPMLDYDGELTEILKGTMKPTDVQGEPGDPGSKPNGIPG